ncbi:efflux RND transporter periplasmic adaptor subunit [Ancylobacter dichloromethanicus]|uniref:MexH family multidrug efflux RND transporter periplasmic adaptor subunit n=1 Tax=Ancylobacter dichloromethanicus TaxID=518825 RepID=A0A9W6N1F9_9HYPH|nr:efflux RND transporter periplasmic adaptor subunit [Ancylobacter dichloromethanicus]GLK74110.1 MexH family multidrug efflux RND transporter periplasmic adaptor subunit [Ancylobacter dichloromethanicus]
MRRGTGLLLTIAVLVGAGWLAHEKGWVDVAGIFGVQGEANAAAEPTATPRIPVEVAPARAASVTTDISSIGSLQSDESIKVASEVAGRIQEIRFQEGQHVKAGEVLVQLDAALVKASLDETEARLDLAEANFDRAQRLQKTGSGTARALDEAQAELNTSRALLNSQRVQIAKHTITAPFDGVVGLRSVSNGAYIAVGTELVNLEKIDTLKLDFKVPETQLSSIAEGQTVIITLDALPGRSFSGTIYAIDPMVDINGRSLSVRARLANKDLVLRPGLFARVVVKGSEARDAVFVPESAIVPRGQERLVWQIVDGKAQQLKVQLGQRSKGEVEVEGVAAGASIVVAGQGRLQAGAAVEVVAPPPPAPQG